MKKLICILAVAVLLLAACGNETKQNPNDQDLIEMQTQTPNSNEDDKPTPTEEPDFPEVKKPYTPELAAQNGDVVNVHGKYTNAERWTEFMSNVKSEIKDKVRVTQYTIEGDPILYELTYNGETIKFVYDNSMDNFGVDSKRPQASCKGIEVKKHDNGKEYYALTECDNEKGEYFWLEKE